MRHCWILLGGVWIVAGCAASQPPVATYGPPPKVTEPTPTASEEYRLIVGDDLTPQEKEDLAAIQTTVYTPPPTAAPPSLDAGLEQLLEQEGAVLIDEKIGYDIPIVLNDHVEWWIDYFVRRIPGSFERYLSRSGAWLPYLKAQLREAGLPEDLAYLSMIESGFSTRAVSRVGAVGPWQFMSYTGREYGLRIDRWVDERRDYEASTQAAIEYLSDLHALFGSWYLAAAAYNGGKGRIRRSMMRDNTVNFWELTNLRRETRSYIPKLIAATIIAKQPEKYGFGAVQYMEPIDWTMARVPASTTVQEVADAAGVSMSVIRMLNPHLRRGRTPPGEPGYPIKIPSDRASIFALNFSRPTVEGEPVSTVQHPVREGETMVGIADAYGVDEVEIMRKNGLSDPVVLQEGEVLVIPVTASAGVVESAPLPPEELTYRVVRGDTLSSIARRHGVTVAQLKEYNGLDTDLIRIGERLFIP